MPRCKFFLPLLVPVVQFLEEYYTVVLVIFDLLKK